MKELVNFEYTPDFQPVADDPVSFTLKPLDTRGKTEITAFLVSVGGEYRVRWEGVQEASRYIAGWKGERLGQFSRARLRQLVDGDAPFEWASWLQMIAIKLFSEAALREETAKKS